MSGEKEDIIKEYETQNDEQPEDGEVEVIEDNGKQYPPKWIPVNRRDSPELTSDEDDTDTNLYFFKKDLSLLLINIILFCSNLDMFRGEMTLVNPRITMIVLMAISFTIQIVLGITTLLNSPFFAGRVEYISNSNLLNDIILGNVFLLLIVNVSLWVSDVVEKTVHAT